MIIFLGGLLVFLAASYVTLLTIRLNRFKPHIIQSVKDATGLAVVLRGDINIGLRPGFRIIINDISIRNADWGQRSEMITIRRCEVDLALLPLIKGILEIKRLLFLEPDVFLEISAGGELNFESKKQEGTPIFPAKEVTLLTRMLLFNWVLTVE